MYQTAIVGGGAAGIYTLYRLSEDSKKIKEVGNTILLESTNRLYGRVLSIKDNEKDYEGNPIVYELGAMRYMNHNTILRTLLKKYIGDKSVKSHNHPTGFLHIRGKRIPYMDANRSYRGLSPRFDEVYLVNQDEKGRDPNSMFRTALYRSCVKISASTKENILTKRKLEMDEIVPLKALDDWLSEVLIAGPSKKWPIINVAAAQALRTLASYGNRMLNSVAFNTMLQNEMSTEAYHMIKDGIGYVSITSEWNAADALVRLMNEVIVDSEFKTCNSGMSSILKMLIEKAKSNFKKEGFKLNFLMKHQVLEIEKLTINEYNSYNFILSYNNISKDNHLEVDKLLVENLFLCIPSEAINNINFKNFDDFNNFEKTTTLPHNNKTGETLISTHCKNVIGQPLLKIILNFDSCWWKGAVDRIPKSAIDGKDEIDGKCDFDKVITDTALRQIYLSRSSKTKNIVMIYVDGASARLWDTYRIISNYNSKDRPIVPDIPPLGKTLNNDAAVYNVTDALFSDIRQLLASIFEIEPSQIPKPAKANLMSWSGHPYYAGWHSWIVDAHSDETRSFMAKPLNNKNIVFGISSEAFSSQQGWIEGAFRSAEYSLNKNGWGIPKWLEESEYLKYDICGCSKGDELIKY